MVVSFFGRCAGFRAPFDEATLPANRADYPSGLVWKYCPAGLAESLKNPRKSAILVKG